MTGRASWHSCVAAAALAATLAAGAAPASGARSRRPRVRPVAFASCAQLVHYGRAELARTQGRPEPVVTPVDEAPPAPVSGTPTPTSAPTAGATAPAAGTPAATGSFSTTNTQEPGVDEPDIVKTDGRTVFAVEAGTLRAVDVSGGAPKVVGSLALPQGESQLLLRGQRLIAVTSGYAYPVPLAARAAAVYSPYHDYGHTTLTEIDVRDPASMKVTRTMTVDGSFVDARQVGGSARLVIESRPRAIAYPAAARAASGWIPSRSFHSLITRRRYTVPVAPCRRVLRPAEYSGLGMVTILTVDLDRGLYATDSQALMADPRIVYGSPTSLYLATQRWVDPSTPESRLPSGQRTVIDRFDLSDPDRAVYAGSGEVPGYVLNQFSLSEYKGFLRVATTSEPIWWSGVDQPPRQPSQSYATVLAVGAAGLPQVAQVSGLGVGQRIYSVRFIAGAGYVVTFRRVDPLYVLDLANPLAPRVTGRLELSGYSSYLHPVGSGLLLGVGQDVGAENEPSGSRLDLFDVSDPAAPRLVATASLGTGSDTRASYDHHAFLFWQPTGLAVLPVSVFGSTADAFTGAVAFHVTGTSLSEAGRIQHDSVYGYVPPIDRALVAGGQLYTVSSGGVMESSLAGLAREAFAAFPQVKPPSPCGGGPASGGAAAGSGTAGGGTVSGGTAGGSAPTPMIACPVAAAPATR